MRVCSKCQVINPCFYSQKEGEEHKPAFSQRRLGASQPLPCLEARGNLQGFLFFAGHQKAAVSRAGGRRIASIEVFPQGFEEIIKYTVFKTAAETVGCS